MERLKLLLFPTRTLTFLVFLTIFTGCASIPDYRPIVDTTSLTDMEKYQRDMSECEALTNQVDYSKEEEIASILGAGVGGAAVVGATAAIAGPALAAGATLAPVVWPLLAVGIFTGSKANKRKTNAKEQKLRSLVWNRCLSDRGYLVLTEGYE